MTKDISKRSISLFGWIFCFGVGAPKTVWFYNIANSKHRARLDTLLGINRIYGRVGKKYLYNIVIGRLNFIIAKK